jgi:DNA-binding LytR/AlgR family response regulator
MCPANSASLVTRQPRIRTLVADDEPLARDLMSNLVRRDTDLELVAVAASGSEALTAVADYDPQLLLLDIQMPSLDGISVAEQLTASESAPYIIFVTAHDSYALQAFEVAVRDYLVKPVSKRLFAAAIRRAKQSIGGRATNLSAALVVRNGDALVSLLPEDIVWVSAANQYVRIYSNEGNEYMLSQSLRQFSRSLSDKTFMRIHRSTLINKRYVQGVLNSAGRYQVEMTDGHVLDVARNRKALLSELLAASRTNSQR